MEGNKVIEIKSIGKGFNDRMVLNDVSFNIYPGEMTFIIGTSGAGKTTLLNIIGGLSKPDYGAVIVDGEDIANNLDNYRSKKVGFIFQDFNLISGLSIIDNIKIGDYYSGNKSCFSQKKAEILLNNLEINDSNQKAETLSGGEKQRSALARSVMKESRVIIADEPTGNLDSENANKVLELLKTNKRGRYIIIVSHDMEMAKKYADRIIEISDGKVVNDNMKEDNDKEDFLTNVVRKGSFKKDLKPRFKANVLLGLNGIKRRKGKILSIVLVMMIAITSLAIVINMTEWGNSITNRVNKYYLETDLITITQNNKESYPTYRFYPFSAEQIEYLNEKYSGSTLITKYYVDSDVDDFLIGTTMQQCQPIIKQINIDEYFEERVAINTIEGEFPKTDDEIIISEDISNQLFNGDGINETIQIFGNNGGSIDCKVSGINHTENALGTIYTYVSSNLLKMLFEKQIKSQVNQPLIINEKDDINGYSFPGSLCKSDLTTEISIISGRLPENKNEVMVSSNSIKKELGSDWASQFDVIQNKLFLLDFNGRFEVKIVGVFESNEFEIRCDEGLLNDILIAKPVSIDIFLADKYDTATTYNEIMEEGNYFCTYRLEQLKKEVNGTINYLKTVLLVFGVILSIISLALINSYSKITILERKHELAIIRCLGAKNSDLLVVLLFDSLIISFLAIISGMISTFVINLFMPSIFSNMNYIDFSYPWVVVLSIGGEFAILTVIITIFYFIKIAKTMPADLLVDR